MLARRDMSSEIFLCNLQDQFIKHIVPKSRAFVKLWDSNTFY